MAARIGIAEVPSDWWPLRAAMSHPVAAAPEESPSRQSSKIPAKPDPYPVCARRALDQCAGLLVVKRNVVANVAWQILEHDIRGSKAKEIDT
jgi:hypothetical protein